MPKETFNKLPIEKQEAIFNACVKEFSSFPYSQASINQIIKTAQISRGSFYQYFEDKWDAYEMMLMRIAKEKLDLLPTKIMNTHFFDVMEQFFHDTMAWIQLKPDYYQIGMFMDVDNDEMVERMREKHRDRMKFLEAMIEEDQKEGLIDPSVHPKDLVEMISDVSKTSLLKAFKSKDYDEMRNVFLSRLNIIKKGVQYHV